MRFCAATWKRSRDGRCRVKVAAVRKDLNMLLEEQCGIA